MVVGGLPMPRDDHAEAIADMAIAMLTALTKISQQYNIPLDMRIGINSGPVVAGVIGKESLLTIYGETL